MSFINLLSVNGTLFFRYHARCNQFKVQAVETVVHLVCQYHCRTKNTGLAKYVSQSKCPHHSQEDSLQAHYCADAETVM